VIGSDQRSLGHIAGDYNGHNPSKNTQKEISALFEWLPNISKLRSCNLAVGKIYHLPPLDFLRRARLSYFVLGLPAARIKPLKNKQAM
jgi:hypothetical protein